LNSHDFSQAFIRHKPNDVTDKKDKTSSKNNDVTDVTDKKRRSGETYTRPSQPPSTPWAGLSPRAVDQLAREFSGLETSSVSELEDAIRSRLAKNVPAEAIDAEVEKVVRRVEALGDADGTVINFPTHARRATEPASYEVLGPAPPGERCIGCGKGGGVKRIRHSGEVDLLHEGCARAHSAAMANPPFELPDLGPAPLDEHGAPRAGSVPLMMTHDMKRRLRAYGLSDQEIAHLTPQRAHEILDQEGRQPNA
jgi:hypothetical protein